MSGVDTRNISRDSLFLMANVYPDGGEAAHRVKVRNLSAGGMMAEGGPHVERGTPIAVDLRNIGKVEGIVAWIEDGRFGIAFTDEIDPKLARSTASTQSDNFPPRYVRPIGQNPGNQQSDPQKIRKI
ncbi:MAG: PilZ domain-containing protein [Pontixanthobacter sp.]